MFTQEIFMCFFVFVIGNIFGKFFKKFNPFFMLFGVIIFSPFILNVLGWDRWYYTLSLVAGTLFVFGNPFRFVSSLWTEASMSFRLARARREANRWAGEQYHHQETGERFRQEQEPKPGPQERERERDAEDRRERAYKANQQARKTTSQAESDRQKEAEEEIRKQAEALRHREETLRQEQARAYREQMNRQEEATQKPELDPAKIQDAYRILNLEPGRPLSDYRKAWTQLLLQYHPDKTAHLGAKLQEVALLETQRLNKAFETIKKSF